MARHYDIYGNGSLAPISAAEREREMARLQKKDDDAARSRAAWNRLCGMASPIGGPSGR